MPAPGEVLTAKIGEDGKIIQYVVDKAVLQEHRKEFEEMRAAERSRIRDEIRKQLFAEDPEYKRIVEEIQPKMKAFAENFKTQMFDAFTDEQWSRLQELLVHPPEHALAFRKSLREMLGGSDESEENKTSTESKEPEKPDMWIPGPGAWQPGSSAIPEQYRQERGRFPRGEN